MKNTPNPSGNDTNWIRKNVYKQIQPVSKTILRKKTERKLEQIAAVQPFRYVIMIHHVWLKEKLRPEERCPTANKLQKQLDCYRGKYF